jgi:calcium-dependent protein kinase
VGRKLGEGSFGTVVHVTHKLSGIERACKMIKKKKINDPAEV